MSLGVSDFEYSTFNGFFVSNAADFNVVVTIALVEWVSAMHCSAFVSRVLRLFAMSHPGRKLFFQIGKFTVANIIGVGEGGFICVLLREGSKAGVW